MPDILPIECDGAPKAIGPYSQAIKVDQWIYVSGQIPLDPQTGEVAGSDIAAQTEQVMKNLEAILQFAGLQLSNVVKTTCYLTDLGEFAQFNAVYAKHFVFNPPARATIQAAALPKGVRVEIDCVAHIPKQHDEVEGAKPLF
ncbi:RidA family protein [Candidatus Sumerlaeota bacterium]|nr:RidA family protein [Candidatus Sumerlaeota bacterium]